MTDTARHQTNSLLGHTIGPAHRLVALLDAEGLTDAYRAWDHAADRYVAIKALAMPLPDTLLRRFEFALSACGLEPLPHVVPSLEQGVYQNRPFAVLPFLAGGSLRQRRPSENDRLLLAHPALLRAWLPAVAAALDAIHDRGLVHGAVSPSTILFDAAGAAALADFRLAAALRGIGPTVFDAPQRSADAGGRAAYLCPQRVHGLPPSPASDQYALAATIYEFLTTVAPFGRGSCADVAAAQASHALRPMRQLSPSLPEPLCLAVQKGLAHNPRDRHASCSDLAAAVLAAVPEVATPRKTRLECPACRNLIVVEPESAGRQGACLSCSTLIEIDSELRWLCLPSDRRANVPVAGATPAVANPRHMQKALTWAGLAAAFAIVAIFIGRAVPPSALPQPADSVAFDAPPPEPESPDEAAPAPAPDHAAVPDDEESFPEPAPALAEADAAPRDEPPPVMPEVRPKPPAEAVAAELPPQVPPAPPAPPPRPVALDAAKDKVRADLEAHHATRKELREEESKERATIAAERRRIKNLTLEEPVVRGNIAAVSRQREALLAQFGAQPAGPALQQLNFANGQLLELQTRLLDIDNDREAAKDAIASSEKRLAEIVEEGENLRVAWIARLNPMQRDEFVAIKIETLSAEATASPDFPEARLYLSLLHCLDGNRDDARIELKIADEILIKGADPIRPCTVVDFVYANLLVGNGPAARRYLRQAEKQMPNDPILQHIQALCEIADDDFSKAALLLKAALRSAKKFPPRERALLCSDAAWLFAAAPNDAIRNPALAERYAAEAIAAAAGKAWQARRAQAVLLADAGQWRTAEAILKKAREVAPLVMAEEIDEQLEAVSARQSYRMPRRKT